MKPFQIYRPPQRTIVTEMRQFMVDNTRRQGINAFSVATKVTQNTLEQKDVDIGPDNPYTLKDVHNIVSIQCPHPITIELLGFGVLPEPEVRTEQEYFDAEIEIGRADAGRFVSVTVKDADIFTSAPIAVQVLNMRTGETEEVVLERVAQGVYSGFLMTQNNDAQGVDFDRMMFCRKDDILRFKYDEPYGASGMSQVVEKEQVVTLDFVPTEIVAPASIPFGKFINFQVTNPQEPTVIITNLRSGSTKTVTAAYFEPIEVTFTDGPNSFAADDGDIFQLVTQGKDIHGDWQSVIHEITIQSGVMPVIESQTQVDVAKPFTALITDLDLPINPTVTLRNQYTGATYQLPLVPHGFGYSGKYRLEQDALYRYALPGQPVTLEYTSSGGTATKQLELVAAPAPEQPTIEPPTDAGIQTSPVRLVVNGHFFLNGSFAGTIKLMAEKLTRVTLIKA